MYDIKPATLIFVLYLVFIVTVVATRYIPSVGSTKVCRILEKLAILPEDFLQPIARSKSCISNLNDVSLRVPVLRFSRKIHSLLVPMLAVSGSPART